MSDGRASKRIWDLALQNNSRETIDGAIGVDFVCDGLRVTGDLGYQERNIRGVDADHYLASDVTELPRAPEADAAHFQPWSYQETDATYGVLRAEYEFNPHAMAYAAAGFGHSEARLVASFAFPLQQLGDFTENYWGDAQDYDSFSTEAGLRAVARTGTVEHQLAIAAMQVDREDGVVNIFEIAQTRVPATALVQLARIFWRVSRVAARARACAPVTSEPGLASTATPCRSATQAAKCGPACGPADHLGAGEGKQREGAMAHLTDETREQRQHDPAGTGRSRPRTHSRSATSPDQGGTGRWHQSFVSSSTARGPKKAARCLSSWS